jgi:hypothetical protein
LTSQTLCENYRDSHKHGSYQHPQFQDEIPDTRPRRYHPKELSLLLSRTAKEIDFSKLSSRVKETLRGDVPRCRSKQETYNLMKAWFSVFVELFFFPQVHKVLKGGMKVHYKLKSSDHGLFCSSCKGIELNMYEGREGVFGEYDHICTLLHEMVHAFVEIFSCNKKRCRRKKTRADWGLGIGGYGSVWCNSMVPIEHAFSKMVRWLVECGVQSSLESEMGMHKPVWQPRQEQLARWGLLEATARDSKGRRICRCRHEYDCDVCEEDGDWEGYDEEDNKGDWEYVWCCVIF